MRPTRRGANAGPRRIMAGMKRTPSDAWLAGRVVTAAALSSDDPAAALPTRLKILAWGANPNSNGRDVIVGDAFVKALADARYPFRKIPIDFEHNTVPGTAAHAESREPRPIAGYATVEAVPGEGVFLNVTRWTAEGRATARSFEDLSACPVIDEAGNVIALPSCALCRTGAVPGIEFAQSPLAAWPCLAAIMPEQPAQPKENKMDYKKFLLGLLKLPETATDADIDAAIAAINEKPAPMGADAIKTAIDGALAPLRAEVDAQRKAAVLLGARLEGKVVALNAEAIGKLSVADLEAHVAALKPTVPLSALTPDQVDETTAAKPLSADQEAIARHCGLDPAEVFGKPKEG